MTRNFSVRLTTMLKCHALDGKKCKANQRMQLLDDGRECNYQELSGYSCSLLYVKINIKIKYIHILLSSAVCNCMLIISNTISAMIQIKPCNVKWQWKVQIVSNIQSRFAIVYLYPPSCVFDQLLFLLHQSRSISHFWQQLNTLAVVNNTTEYQVSQKSMTCFKSCVWEADQGAMGEIRTPPPPLDWLSHHLPPKFLHLILLQKDAL